MTKTTTLQQFNAVPERRRALADACQKNPDYLYLVGKGFKRASTDLAKCIEVESERIWRRVPKETLRPDVWELDVNDDNARTNNGRIKKQ